MNDFHLPIQIAFIGGGMNSAVGQAHRIAIEMDQRYHLAAGCFSTHDDINKKTAASWGVDEARLYKTWQELLQGEKGKLDAIVVLTPTPSHKEIVIAALEQNFAVICEKALATSSADAEEILQVALRKQSFLTVTYNYTGYPMVRELKMMIAAGKLGKITQVHVEMPQEGFLRRDKAGRFASPQSWRLADPLTLTTLALDLGVHTHQMVYFLTGEHPLEAVAMEDSFGAFTQIVDNSVSLVRYTNGMVCNMWYSKSALGHRNGLRIRVYGTEGSAEWIQMNPEVLTYVNQFGEVTLTDRTTSMDNLPAELRYNRFKAGHPAGFIEAFANLYYDIADSLKRHRAGTEATSSWVFSAGIAVEGLQLLESLSLSAKRKTWVQVSATAVTR